MCWKGQYKVKKYSATNIFGKKHMVLALSQLNKMKKWENELFMTMAKSGHDGSRTRAAGVYPFVPVWHGTRATKLYGE